MADLLIPLLVLFAIVGIVLIGALVHQLRDLEPRSERPLGGGTPASRPSAPALPWQRVGEEEPRVQPARGPRRGSCSTCGGSGRAIVQGPGGGLKHGPCPDCQGQP